MKTVINKEVLLVAAQACINTYKGEHGKTDDTLFDEVEWFYDLPAPKYFIGWRQSTNTLWIVFRGTSGKAGWENNFDYQQVPKWTLLNNERKYGFYHKGFFKDEVLKVEAAIRDKIYERWLKNKLPFNIIVTGHSKGGSNALLMAMIIKDIDIRYDIRYIDNLKCVSLAPARVTSPLAARQYKKLKIPTMIFQYGNDTVCRVPFRLCPGLIERKIKFFKWRYWLTIQLWAHPGKVTHIGRPWYVALMHWIPIIRFTGNPLDHRPEKYLEGIKNLK